MPDYDYDLFVIGAGSGGVRAARFSATMGAKVGIAEDRYLGGTCVNVGCIPKKMLVYASHYRHDFEDAHAYGWGVEPSGFDWQRLIGNKDTEIARLNGIYERLLGNAGVELHEGRATLVDAHTVDVAGKKITAKYVLVAVGGWPFVPDIPGKEHIITSNEAFYLDALPKRVVVVGGGYIAVEFAGIFNSLGVETTLVYRGPHFLRGFDEDVRHFLADEMRKQGVTLEFNQDIAKVEQTEDGLCAALKVGRELHADQVMYCTGRVPNTKDLGLEAAGVEMAKNGAIVVDDYFKTSVESVYALGDVINRIQLTPVALAEGMALARHLFGGQTYKIDYENVPTAVFSQPSIGTVGLTEHAARERYGKLKIFSSDFTPLKHTLTGRKERSLMKLIVDAASDRVVGAHMVGPEAGEIIQGIGIALKCGATKAQFDATIGVHPTLAEEFCTMREAVRDDTKEDCVES